jgi:hypothetical protein
MLLQRSLNTLGHQEIYRLKNIQRPLISGRLGSSFFDVAIAFQIHERVERYYSANKLSNELKSKILTI